MDVLVPFAAGEPKTRLADVLEPDERAEFARAMLLDVCDTIIAAGGEPTILSTQTIESQYPVVVDDRPLSDAVDAHLDVPMAIVMADLALVTSTALQGLFEATGDVVVAPGLGGGTNALVVRDADFSVDYHGVSVEDHRRIAEDIDATTTTVDSFRLAVDIDQRNDLAELLLHGEGRAREWLESAGFELETTNGRVVATRE